VTVQEVLNQVVEDGLGLVYEDPCYPKHYYVVVDEAKLGAIQDRLGGLPVDVLRAIFVQVSNRPPKHLALC